MSEEDAWRIARAFGVPMYLVNGRPWVASEDEQPDDEEPA